MGIGDGAWAMVVMAEGDTDVAVWPLYWPRAGGRPPDLSVVDAVARLQLAARRLGLDVRLRAPCPELRALLDLTGLTDAFVEQGVRGEAGGRTPRTVSCRGNC